MAKEYDMDKDGDVTNEELSLRKEILDLENSDKRQDQQRRMVWIAMLSMLIFTMLLFTPWISPERIEAVSNLLGMFYIAQAGIVASFFGAQAFMSVNKSE